MSTSYRITTVDDHVHVETIWSDVSEGYDQCPGSFEQDFATLADVLKYTGGCRYNMDGERVDVLLDGIAINESGLPTDEYAGSENGWSFGTDNDD